MAANVDTVIFHGGSISENVTRIMVYICAKFHASTYKPTIFPHICWTTMRVTLYFPVAEVIVKRWLVVKIELSSENKA